MRLILDSSRRPSPLLCSTHRLQCVCWVVFLWYSESSDLFVCLSVCLSVCLFVVCLSVCCLFLFVCCLMVLLYFCWVVCVLPLPLILAIHGRCRCGGWRACAGEDELALQEMSSEAADRPRNSGIDGSINVPNWSPICNSLRQQEGVFFRLVLGGMAVQVFVSM